MADAKSIEMFLAFSYVLEIRGIEVARKSYDYKANLQDFVREPSKVEKVFLYAEHTELRNMIYSYSETKETKLEKTMSQAMTEYIERESIAVAPYYIIFEFQFFDETPRIFCIEISKASREKIQEEIYELEKKRVSLDEKKEQVQVLFSEIRK